MNVKQQLFRSILGVGLSLSSFAVFAQTKTITGNVSDEKGAPIAGASIKAVGTTVGTFTVAAGSFQLNVPDTVSQLEISYVGYATQIVSITGQTSISVQLKPAATTLNDIVVIGYGTARRKDVTGSISTLSAKNFNQGPVINPLQQVSGKIPGLVITLPSGDPNATPNVRLRGQTSLTGNQNPLIVVDGVPLPDPNILSSLSPSDFADYNVLKDASATAIYGSRGANGVILITTKKGLPGKVNVEYNGTVGVDHNVKKYDLLNAAQFKAAGGATNNAATAPYNFTLTNGNTDWMDAITRTGVTTNQYVGISGGGDHGFSYHGSFNYFDQKGIVINTGKQMYGLNFNAQQKALDDKLTITMSVNTNRVNRRYVDPVIFYDVLQMSPIAPVYDSTGNYYGFFNSFDVNNPVAKQEMQLNTGTEQTTLWNGSVDYELVPGLKVGTAGSMFNYTLQRDFFQPVMPGYGNINNGGKYTQNANAKRGELHGNYNHDFGKHNIDITGVYEYNTFENDYNYSYGQNYLIESNQNNNLGSGNPQKVQIGSNKTGFKIISFLGRVRYNYASRYYLTASVRRDGSDKFGVNHQWGTFPSLSASWRVSQETFMKNVSWVNNLTLGAGWGKTGNGDGLSPYQTLSLLGQGSVFFNPANASFSYPTSYTAIQNPNPDLRWETRQGFNVQAEFALFNNRLNGSVNLYRDKTDNLIYNYTVPTPPFAVGNIWANVGSLTNRGLEIQLNGDIVRRKDITWNLGGQISFNKTRVVSLAGSYNGFNVNTNQIIAGSAVGRGLSNAYLTYLVVGYSPYVFWLPHYVGLNADGKELFSDGKGGTVTADGLNNDMKRYIDPAPKFTYGITNSLTYKKFGLDFLLRGVYGQKIYDGVRMLIDNIGGLNNANMTVSGLKSGDKDNKVLSDKWLESGSFLRMDNITLSYNLGNAGKHIDNLKIFIVANNLFVITKYRGLDPEIQITSGTFVDPSTGKTYVANNAYIDQLYTGTNPSENAYYKPRSFSLGVNVSFK